MHKMLRVKVKSVST